MLFSFENHPRLLSPADDERTTHKTAAIHNAQRFSGTRNIMEQQQKHPKIASVDVFKKINKVS